jgi:hypothetical protein
MIPSNPGLRNLINLISTPAEEVNDLELEDTPDDSGDDLRNLSLTE